MSECLFCKLVQGTIPSTKVFGSEKVIGFKDLRPQAAKHYLFIHRDHTRDINHLMSTDPAQIGDLFEAMRSFTESEGLEKDGFRIVTNMGPFAGQTVFHTHFHLLAGEPLGHFGS